ncbi:MAG: ABC transporter substrate-binding protein [Patescibacteria group bacterium]
MKKIIKIFSSALMLVFLLTTGLTCGGGQQASVAPVTLEYWGVWHEPDDIQTIISDYRLKYPNVTINYRKFRFEEYEKELLEAFAEDRGPDIFQIHNTWVNEYLPKITPLPNRMRLSRKVVETGLRSKETTVTEDIVPLGVKDVSAIFPEVVAEDVVWPDSSDTTTQDRIFGLPLYLDSLVMFYNRDLFNNANIPQPPRNWNDFISAVQRLTTKDTDGNILISGAAMGAADNVTRFFDILSLLMMQNGTAMATKSGNVTFDEIPAGSGLTSAPGLEALDFYTSFSMIDKGVYTWNQDSSNSLDAFISGQAAIFFGYSYHIPVINSRAPKLNYEIASMPQVDEKNRTNYANYWVETVSKKSKNVSHAWNFIYFATSQTEAEKYLASANRPTALRALINKQLQDPDLDVFADQVLTAKSWYRGKDSEAAESIFKDMVNSVLEGTKLSDAVKLAVQRIRLTWRQ